MCLCLLVLDSALKQFWKSDETELVTCFGIRQELVISVIASSPAILLLFQF